MRNLRSELAKLRIDAESAGLLDPPDGWGNLACLAGIDDPEEIDRRKGLIAAHVIAVGLASAAARSEPWYGDGPAPEVVSAMNEAAVAMDRAILAGPEAIAELQASEPDRPDGRD